MEISVGKSLDLKTLYKEETEGAETKKRKSRKEVVISSFNKKIKQDDDDDDTEVDDCPSRSSALGLGLGQKINGTNGFNAVGIGIGIINISGDVPIPKRPRGSVGRTKFPKTHLLEPSAASHSVEKVAMLKDELKEVLQTQVSGMAAQQNGKFNGKSRTKHKVVIGYQKQDSASGASASHAKTDSVKSLASKDQVVNKLPGAEDASLSSSSLGSIDQVAKLKHEINNKDASVSSNSTSTSADLLGKLNKGKLRNIAKKKGGIDRNQKQNEDLVLNNKESSSKRNGTKRRKRKMLGSSSQTVAKKVESSVEKIEVDPDDDLEQNAARMLSSRFDPSCTGFASKNTTLNGVEKPKANAVSYADAADRVLRPRRHPKGKGNSRKRRHFYEIHSDDMDAHWFLNRKIKIFWPLDESWYYGLVNDYDAERNLHHIKYDDRDEEWISLENERFKLLLLPSEIPRKPSIKDTPSEDDSHKEDSTPLHINDEAFMATHMESEPIISWLTHRVKSSTHTCLKKQKVLHLHSHNSVDVYNMERESCSSAFLNTSMDIRRNEMSVRGRTNNSEGHIPIVYVRRRYRKFCDAAPWSLNNAGVLNLYTTSIQCKKFEICISLWPMLRYVLGADILWLLRTVFLLQYGTLVKIWPTVFLEVLFVDNIVGLRLFFFEGCLKQAVAFVFLVMKVFCEPEIDESINQQIPVTSVRFKVSFFHNFREHKVFTYYSFSKVRDFNWQYLDSKFQPHCLLSKQLSLSECTYDNIKLMEAGTQYSRIPYAGQTASFEVFRKKSNPGGVPLHSSYRSSNTTPGSRPSAIYSMKHGSLPPFALSFTAAPNFFLSLHLKLLLERSISLQDHGNEDQLEISSESSSKSHEEEMSSLGKDDAGIVSIDMRKSSKLHVDTNFNVDRTCISSKAAQTVTVEIGNSDKYQYPTAGTSNLKGICVEIPTSDDIYRDMRRTPGAQQASDLAWSLSDGIICSPDPRGPRSFWHPNKSGSSCSPFGDSWATDGKSDFIGNGFGNGPKKPRTQVQYTLPCREFNLKNKGHIQTGLPYQRIRKANDKKTLLDASSKGGPRRNLELVACDVNILINGGDKGWRECGARVFLEVADQNEWKLAVKCRGELKYAYKVHQDLQPGSTNRYTHAMMWKGGKDWALEFPDRSQWVLFKEMHEECHNRNIRAASIKNIPIPGVRLIEDLVDGDQQEEMPFVRSPWYFRQVRNDVEMAMDASHVMYDMDSEDENWVSRMQQQQQGREDDMISDELFEKVMDMLEKVSYAQKRDHFTSGEVEELIARVSPMQVAKSVYEHWREKRQRKGMPLIRQLQPPLWERYQQTCREWDELKPKLTTSGSQEKASAGDKPPMFAFCLKPRGLELLNKGSKHRPHKKISLSGHSHAFLGDHDAPHHSSGRRVVNNAYAFGDESSAADVSPLLSKMISPRDRDGGGPGHFSLDSGGGGDVSEWNRMIHRNNSSKSLRTVISPKMAVAVASSTSLRKAGKRNNGKKVSSNPPEWHSQPSPPILYRHHHHPGQQILLGGPDLDEFRLRDASSAAKHARNMAKLKRERAQKLMLSADLAIHKAVSALMTAEAIKSYYCTADDDDDDDDDDEEDDDDDDEDDDERIKSTTPPSSTG